MAIIQEKYQSMDPDTIRRLGMNINFGGTELEADTVEKILIDSAGNTRLRKKWMSTLLSWIHFR